MNDKTATNSAASLVAAIREHDALIADLAERNADMTPADFLWFLKGYLDGKALSGLQETKAMNYDRRH
jgi:hypothetical protein